MNPTSIHTVSIIGMGALGLLYGTHIMDALADTEVTYIMDDTRYEKYKQTVTTCNGEARSLPMVRASKAKPCDLVIVAVKYNSLTEAINQIAPCIGPDTLIVSLLNGITSEDTIGKVYGLERLIYTVCQGTDACKIGNDFHYTKKGHLHIGAAHSCQESALARIQEFFDWVKIPYVLESHILYRMWSKFMLNVGVNQSCMVHETTYGGVCQEGMANMIMIAAMREVISLGKTQGVQIKEEEINQYVALLETLDKDSRPSMAQDRMNRKASEVEMFAGTVIRLGAEQNIYVPVNHFLYNKVKEIEEAYT